ncbi:MAG: UDP-N-acetylmuramate dehydrogenase [Clostridiales bacterium]|nr:UDP-N-acetylmuramate dehydrogenase [Eubacteriales bacterium]MDH7567295.1 UDP-N-acetylmuramate dehydrogenase [Clostridiales bacterium]
MNKERMAVLLGNIVGPENLKINEPMKNHTSFKVGGPADLLVTPANAGQILKILEICKDQEIPFLVMGNGTNLVVRDKGFRGVAIKIFDRFGKYSVNNNILEAEAGILLSKLSNIALRHGLTGLEFASGIPGTLGGAVVMNAGAYGGEMKNVVVKTEYIDLNGNIKTITHDQHRFGYRTSIFQEEGGVVLKSQIKLGQGIKEEIEASMEELARKRKEKQPLHMPSAGSVFKRPEGYYAGKLIEDCGMKGFRIGGAEVSTLHCGFIVNTGNASASDVIRLIQHIQNAVKMKFGVELETEVRIVGEE